jgi:hypothetical protein
LLAASVPGLLMLATFGLQRLEAGICVGTCRDGAELTQQPKIRTEPRLENDFPSFPSLRSSFGTLDDEPRLPTRLSAATRIHAEANTQFRPTRETNRV